MRSALGAVGNDGRTVIPSTPSPVTDIRSSEAGPSAAARGNSKPPLEVATLGAGPPLGVKSRGLNLGIAQRPLGILEILDSAMRLYRDNAKPMLVLGVCTVTLCVVLSVGLTLLLLQGAAFNPEVYIQVAGYLNYISGGSLSLASSFIAGIQTIAVARAFEGNPCTTGEATRIVLRRSPRMFGLWLLAKIVQVISFWFCGFPLLITTALFSITGPLAARERPKVGRYLRRCLDLIGRRLWWNVLLVVLVGVSCWLLQYGLMAGLALLGLAGAAGTFAAVPVMAVLAYGLSQILIGSVLMPFVAATATVTYFDALVRYDGYDLVETARRLDPSSVEVPGVGVARA